MAPSTAEPYSGCQALPYTLEVKRCQTVAMETFGDRLRVARKQRDLTQDELADLIDVTKSAVSGWENNRDLPGLDKLPKLRTHLRVSLDVLVCGALDEKPETHRVHEASSPGYWAGPADALPREQRQLIDAFERLSSRRRKALLELLEA